MAESMKDYETELEASFKKIEEGDILTGTVVSRIQSTTRHVEPCGKSGGPPPKAKYYLVTDSA